MLGSHGAKQSQRDKERERVVVRDGQASKLSASTAIITIACENLVRASRQRIPCCAGQQLSMSFIAQRQHIDWCISTNEQLAVTLVKFTAMDEIAR